MLQKDVTERRRGTPPKRRKPKAVFTSRRDFLFFIFSSRPCHHSHPQRIDPDRSHKNARIHVHNGTVDNYTAHSKTTS